MKTFILSLRTKMIVISLILLLIPSLIIGLIGFQVAQQQLNQSGKIQLQNDVHFINASIANLNSEVIHHKITLAEAQRQIKEEILGPKQKNGHRPINHAFNLGKSGYFFILDKSGVELAHPTIEGTTIWTTVSPDGKKIGPELINAGLSGGGFVTYAWQLPNSKQVGMKIVYSEAAPAWGWIVCAGSYMADFNSGANQVLVVLGFTLAFSLLLGIILVIVFSNRVASPIKAITKQIGQVSTGDLQITPMKFKRKDEIGQLASHFYTMTEQLTSAITKLSDTSSQVAASAEQLTASSGENNKATEHITLTIQESAIDAENQAIHLGESASAIEHMSSGIQNISGSAMKASRSALEATKMSDIGAGSILRASVQMNTIDESVEDTARVIQKLAERSGEIGQIVNLITNISEQTNLLALNAAIEAARAGAAGQGFAVVADEVRKLAEQSAASAKQISNVIISIQDETIQAVNRMNESTEAVRTGRESVALAGDSFKSIKDAVTTVAQEIEEVSSAIQDISSNSQQLKDKIGQISQMSNASSLKMQNISVITEEQLAAIEEISASAASLGDLADSLHQLVTQFHIS